MPVASKALTNVIPAKAGIQQSLRPTDSRPPQGALSRYAIHLVRGNDGRLVFQSSLRQRCVKQAGFTLVELIVGLVMTGIALTLVSVMFFSAPGRSAEPMLQIRAAELGQALMDEILAKPFDENTPLGGYPPCTTCSATLALGPDGETRANYDDVDDYDSYCDTSEPYQAVEDYQGRLPSGFDNFSMSICVYYDDNYDGAADASTGSNAKLIIVDIYPPGIAGSSPQQFRFKAYKGNY